MDKINKIFNFEIKQVGDEKDRVLRFCGSNESPDRDNDIIEVAGWKTDDYMKNPVILWAHNGYSIPPIAKCLKVEKDLVNKRLMFDVKFPTLEELSSDIQNASEHAKFCDTIYNMCKNKYLNATSVGFRGIKFKTRDDADVLEKPEWQRGRRYIEQALMELSICDIPCNPSALQEAKAAGLIDEIQIKSFFMPEKEEKTLKTVDLICDSSTKEVFVSENGEKTAKVNVASELLEKFFAPVEKSGARLSSDSKAKLKAIHETMTKCHGDFGNVAKMLKEFMEDPEDSEGDEAEEEPKSLESDIEKAVKNAFELYLKDLENRILKGTSNIEPIGLMQSHQEDANKGEIDLDAIETPKTEKNAAQTELDFKAEDLKEIIREVISEEIKAATGKI